MNIQEVRTAPRSPWQNAYVERVIGSIRRECLDHVIVVNTNGLHRVLTDGGCSFEAECCRHFDFSIGTRGVNVGTLRG